MCFGLLAYNVIEIFIIIYFSKKVTQIGYFTQLKSISPIFILALSMGGIMYFSISFIKNTYSQLFFGGLIGIIVYLTLSSLFKIKEFIFLKLSIKKLSNIKFLRQ
jgi:hypothetical protein